MAMIIVVAIRVIVVDVVIVAALSFYPNFSGYIIYFSLFYFLLLH